MLRRLLALVAVLLACGSVLGQEGKKKNAGYPPTFEGAKAEVYKAVGDVKLNLYIFNPTGHQPSDKRPAIVFFFGGGWRSGNPRQFEQHCRHLAGRGMVAITADYRVASRHNIKAVSCVADAKSAIRFVRQEAARLGIDPNKIVAAGGSAGGHLAACTGTIKEFDEAGEDLAVSSVPNALVLFNPALVLAPVEGLELDRGRAGTLGERMGVEPQKLSPYHHVRKGAPPTIIFHGQADGTVPYATAEAFAKAMTTAGNQCELVGYAGQPHGFFNYGRSGNEYYEKTVKAMDEFLARQGFIKSDQ